MFNIGWVIVLSILFSGMDSPKYYQREASQKLLQIVCNNYDIPNDILLLSYGQSPEVQARVQNVISNYYNPITVKLASRGEFLPKIVYYNGLQDGDWSKLFDDTHYAQYNGNSYNENGEYTGCNTKWEERSDAESRNATRDFVKVLQKRGMTRNKIVEILDSMADNEYADIKFMPEPPPYECGLMPFPAMFPIKKVMLRQWLVLSNKP